MPIFENEVNRMGICKHMFVGTAEGIHCTRCGLKLSPAEYAAMQNAPKPETKKPARAGKKVTKDE